MAQNTRVTGVMIFKMVQALNPGVTVANMKAATKKV